MIPPPIASEIVRRLRAAEAEHGVTVLLAVESGSRAWGFASPNSDYDARFIYVHPRSWYLAVDLEERRDVIEYPITDDIDLNGWDLRKALRLFAKSNPAFVEWIQSPITYVQDGRFAARALELLPSIYSCASGIHHYRSMAKTNYRGYLRTDLVPLKKYFYVLRPLLSAVWLERYGSPAPVEFSKLLHLVQDQRLLEDIQALLERKRAAPEMGRAPQVTSIHAFIERELARLDELPVALQSSSSSMPRLNELFTETLSDDA